ncbi:MAG: lactate racemase domain-containing protein [Planctomycetaceae bacterium]
MACPRMYRIRQQLPDGRLDDVAGSVETELSQLNLASRVRAGESVAITVGSRGIAGIDVITRAIVQHFQSLEAKPFLVPAMGSHGGATADGQREVLTGYGVTEEFVGCPIRSSMETVVVTETRGGVPVHFDKLASEADHVVVAGRIKPHTRFVGDIESGLHKMMLIGLGKHAGATVYHQAIHDFTFAEIIHDVADVVLNRCKVICGVAIVENALDQTAIIEAVRPADFAVREAALLRKAREYLPRLPFRSCDLLIVDRIGKDISGTGMDTNVIGRKFNDHEATDQDDADCRRIFVRGLTEKTHGNATGIGIAEFTNKRTIDALDYRITRVNCVTAGHPTGAMLPIWYDTDHEAIAAALSTAGRAPPEQARVLHISDTLHLSECLVSEAYAPEFSSRADLQAVDGPREMQFTADKNLVPVLDGGH